MKWLTDRLITLREALGPFWVKVILVLSSAGLAILGVAREWLDKHGITVGLPSSDVVIVVVGLTLVVWWLLNYATKVRLDNVPLVKVGLAPIENAILKHRVPGGTIESMKRVVRGKVLGISQSVSNCEAHVTAIRYQSAPDGPFIAEPEFASFLLEWPGANPNWASVPKGVTKYFNIVQARQDDNRLYIPGEQSITLLRRLFVGPGKYEIDIIVTAGTISEPVMVEVTWTGNWEDLTAIDKPKEITAL